MDRTPYTPRLFLAEKVDFTDAATQRDIEDRLTRELAAARSGAELETWLDHYGEFEDALDEERSARFIETTRNVEDLEARQRFEEFMDKVDDWFKPLQAALRKGLVEHPAVGELPEYYGKFLRAARTKVDIFQESNVRRETEEQKLMAQYNQLVNLKIPFEGKEWTLKQMEKVQQDPDRERRQKGWEAVQAAYAARREQLDELYDKQLALRHEIARAAGFDNYLDYTFAQKNRVDYTPEDCRKFHEAVARQVVPHLRELHREQKEKLGVEVLRPWDLAVDPEGRAPLKPFETTDQLFEGVRAIFERLDPELGEQFAILKERGFLDLDNRPGKAPGAYNQELNETRLPFTFVNATGTHADIKSMTHEGGHDLHDFAMRNQRLFYYRAEEGLNIEFAEVASMAMEFLAAAHFDQFYGPEDARRARVIGLQRPAEALPGIAAVDAFQNWAYTHPGHSHEERRQTWAGLVEKFGGGEDWGGLEGARDFSWQAKAHIFTHPLYYIEYGFAQSGAVQVWQRTLGSPENARTAVADYRKGLALGGSASLPESYAAMGIHFDPRGELLERLMKKLAEERAALVREELPVPRKEIPQLDFQRGSHIAANEGPASELSKV